MASLSEHLRYELGYVPNNMRIRPNIAFALAAGV
jgi:hypothetical protein